MRSRLLSLSSKQLRSRVSASSPNILSIFSGNGIGHRGDLDPKPLLRKECQSDIENCPTNSRWAFNDRHRNLISTKQAKFNGNNYSFGLPPTTQLSLFHSSSNSRSDESQAMTSTEASTEILNDSISRASEALSNHPLEVSAIADQHWMPTVALQQLIENVHIYSGLPWWASIIATTLGIRFLLFPVVVYQMQLMSRLAIVQPKAQALLSKVKESGYAPAETQKYQQEMRELFKREKTHPFAPVMGAGIQGTTFIFFFFAIQGMAKGLESFKTGGTLWFTDLSITDPLYIFPVLTAATFLLTVELGAVEGLENQPNAAVMKAVFRLLGVAMVPLTMSFPQAMFCYWLPTNLFSLAQATFLKQPKVKKFFGLPLVPPPPVKSDPNAPSIFTMMKNLQAPVKKEEPLFVKKPAPAMATKGRDKKGHRGKKPSR